MKASICLMRPSTEQGSHKVTTSFQAFQMSINFSGMNIYIAQIRFGILPLHIETGRFRGLDLKYRTCHVCGEVEDELHFLFSCKQYVNIRKSFLSSLTSIVQDSQANCFKQLCDKYARRFSKYINSIWQLRKEHMFE